MNGFVNTRIIKVHGMVTTYAWEVLRGGLSMEKFHALLRERGIEYPLVPSKAVSQIGEMERLVNKAGLVRVSTKSSERTFENFDEYWAVSSLGLSVVGVLKDLEASTLNKIKYDLVRSLHKDV